MYIAVLAALLTILIVVFIIGTAKQNRVIAAEVVISKSWSNRFSQQNVEEQKDAYIKKIQKYGGVTRKQAEKKLKNWDKQIKQYSGAADSYMSGKKFSMMDAVSVFGYQILVKLQLNSDSDMIRKLTRLCEYSGYQLLERSQETNGKRNSSIYAYFLIASQFAYAYLGVMLALFLAIVSIAADKAITSVLVVSIVGFVLPTIIGFIPLEDLREKSNRRQEEIDLDFPNLLSKIALLVTAGMNIVKASEEAANSGEGAMYLEMQRTMKDINQSTSVAQAFSDLQCRCNNRYLDKMVSLISKSYSFGNANLAQDLREINADCWLDKKHQSRRMSEKVQSKLFVPTMLMFIGILVVIIIPAMSGFNF